MVQAPRRPTISDVADAAGVSKTAVSFAFNRPDRLASETATRIRSVADSLGYRPHPVARMLSQGRTHTIGVLTPQALSLIFENPFFGTFASGIAAAAEASGYVLQFVSPFRGSLVRAIDRATIDGVVAIGLSANHPEVEQIRQAGVPMVLVDSTAFPKQAGVDVDDEGGARLAAEHLVGARPSQRRGPRDRIVRRGRRGGAGRRPRPAPARLPGGPAGRRASTSPTRPSSRRPRPSSGARPPSPKPGIRGSGRRASWP